jgi:hypothetical protein
MVISSMTMPPVRPPPVRTPPVTALVATDVEVRA